MSQGEVGLIDFGLSDYQAIWQIQQSLVAQRLEGQVKDTLLIGEHPHVITRGRGTRAENLLCPERLNIPVIEIERGGDVTYHGPGQLIAYPILSMSPGQRDLHRYLRTLETVIIETLAAFDIPGIRNPGWTGVWVAPEGSPPQKIASIGVAVRRWVTYHGIALNVSTDLSYFSTINPCGLESTVMTSMETLLSRENLEMNSIKTQFCLSFERAFHVKLTPAKPFTLDDIRYS